MKAHYPWPQYRSPWTVAVKLQVDGRERQDLVHDDSQRIDLSAAGDWRFAKFSVSASTTEAAPDATGESAMVIVSIPRTNTRFATALAGGTGDWYGPVELDISLSGGTAELSLVVLDPHTRKIIGNGEPWTVVCDPGDAPARAGLPPFDTVWEDFSNSERPLLRQAGATYALLDVEPVRPVLYLNGAVEGLQKLLSIKAPKLEKRRLRAVIETSIARDAARTLFRAGLEATTVDGEQVDLPSDHLRRQIVEKVAEQIPSVSDVDELCTRLKGTDTDQATIANAWALVEIAIDGLVDHSRSVATSVEEVRFA